MPRRAGHRLLMAASVVWALSAGQACAQAPAPLALVLEARGTTQPAVQAYTELSGAAPVALSPEARLVFLHYGTWAKQELQATADYAHPFFWAPFVLYGSE